MDFVANFMEKTTVKNCNKMLSYRREIALQGALVLAKSGRLELGDNVLRTLITKTVDLSNTDYIIRVSYKHSY